MHLGKETSKPELKENNDKQFYCRSNHFLYYLSTVEWLKDCHITFIKYLGWTIYIISKGVKL